MKWKIGEFRFFNKVKKEHELCAGKISDCGTFAICKPINYACQSRAQVSHVKTGYLISMFKNEKQAKLFCEKAVNAIDWGNIKVGRDKVRLTRATTKYLNEVRPIIRDIRDKVFNSGKTL